MQLLDTLNNVSRVKKNKGIFVFYCGLSALAISSTYFSFFYDDTVSLNSLQIETPKLRSISPKKRVIGEVKLKQQTALISQVSGVLTQLNIYDGGEIKKNQLIAKLSNPQIVHDHKRLKNELYQLESKIALEMAQRHLLILSKKNEIEKTKLHLELERLKYDGKYTLAQNGTVSSFELKSAEVEVKMIEQSLENLQQELLHHETIFNLEKSSAEKAVATLQGELLLAKEKVHQLNIYAPITGRVLKVHEATTIGASISEGELMAELYKLDELAIRLRVPPSTAKQFSVGLKAKIDIDEKQIEGEIFFIENKVSNGASYVWIETSEPLAKISSEGEQITAHVELPVKDHVNTLRKPDWYAGAGQYQIYCMRRQELSPCNVELGDTDGDYIELVDNHHSVQGFEVSQNKHWLGNTIKVVK